MYAAIAAARAGARVLLLDKNVVGRGGATVMAQMTVAAAIGHQEPDNWTIHLADTIEAGRGLCNKELSALVCEEGPRRILEMDQWGARWARENGHIKQVTAPGHSRARCCYVDFLNTGPSVAGTLRRQLSRWNNIQRLSNVTVTDIVTHDGAAVGAVAINISNSEIVTFDAGAVILAAGGLTKLFRRNSASANMAGEAYALALRAGADLVDMEFVQFFPIAHLAPRLVGMDPIMWDPFRYKLGGRLLNGRFEEFIHSYGGTDNGNYSTVRDQACYAVIKEVEAGRGSPHGGVYLDFRHVPEEQLRSAFGPVIDRLLANGIDLTQTAVEVGPTAHYHMGGVRVSVKMETRLEGLYAAGEAVGGGNGANRLSGNAITEALVLGETAGRNAADHAMKVCRRWESRYAQQFVETTQVACSLRNPGGLPPIALQSELQDLMWECAGPFRTGDALEKALARIQQMKGELFSLSLSGQQRFDLDLQDWFELKAMVTTAEAVVAAALERRESRGAHRRLDFPETDSALSRNQTVEMKNERLLLEWTPVVS